jgi:ribosomal-protein-alanine N-acetyltransferase
VREQDGGLLAGTVNVTNIVRGAFQSAFCGYWAYAGSQGRGLMSDGLRSVVRHAFDELALHRLEANIQPGNVASIALAERCGFLSEGFSPRYLMVDGDWRDHNRYAIRTELVSG